MFKPLPISLAAGVLCSSLLVTAQAQQAPAQPAQPQKLERVEVTGSNIKRTDKETAAPIQIISREDIAASGATSVDELLKKTTLTGNGALGDLNSGNGFAQGTSTVSVRGMGSAATLTLLNGRRMAPAAFSDPNSGQSVIFNVNTIPMSAIDRIEILKDGASAIYGSDALAGVMNIILRRDYKGLEMQARTSQSDNGLFQVNAVNGTYGRGDLANDGYNFFVAVDAQARDGVRLKEALNKLNPMGQLAVPTSFAPTSTNSFPGNYYTYNAGAAGSFRAAAAGCPDSLVAGKGLSGAWTAAGRCYFDLSDYTTLVSKQDKLGALSRFTKDLTAEHQLVAEVMLQSVKTYYAQTPQGLSESVSSWGDASGNRVFLNTMPGINKPDGSPMYAGGLVLPKNHPDNPYSAVGAGVTGLRYRFVDIQSNSVSESKSIRGLLSMNGVLGAWDYKTGLMYSRQDNTNTTDHQLTNSGLARAVQSPDPAYQYRFGRYNSQTVIDNMTDTLETGGAASTTALDFTASREFGKLGAGPVRLALGAEFRSEKFNTNPNAALARGDFIGNGQAQANGSRNVAAGYAEGSITPIKALELTAAIRGERYSDFGNAITGKLGAKWQVNSMLTARGTVSSGFRAPSLTQISKSDVWSFQTLSTDPLRCPITKATEDCNSRTISTSIRYNPDLEPETSRNATLGFILEPNRNFNLGVDYFYIQRDGEIDRLSANTMVTRSVDPAYGSFYNDSIFRNNDPTLLLKDANGVTIPNSGPVTFVARRFLNLGRTVVSGVDVDGNLKFKVEGLGNFNAAARVTGYFRRDRQAEAGAATVNQNGTWQYPEWSAQFALAWTRDKLNLTGTLYHTAGTSNYSTVASCKASYPYAQAGLLDNNPALCLTVPAWTTLDLAGRYALTRNVTLRMAVANITDKKPSFDIDAASSANYNYNFYGRRWTVSATYKM